MKFKPEKNSGLNGIRTHDHCVEIFTLYSFAFFNFYGYITKSQCDQFPIGFTAQSVEHCTGIADATGSNPVQARVFFRLKFYNSVSCVHNCDGQSRLHIFLRSSKYMMFDLCNYTTSRVKEKSFI